MKWTISNVIGASSFEFYKTANNIIDVYSTLDLLYRLLGYKLFLFEKVSFTALELGEIKEIFWLNFYQ